MIEKGGIHGVARAAGVSLMTVSRAMRGVEGVSEGKRAEILTIARSLGYVPNNNARALSQSNSTLIGVSLPTLFNDVFADILAGMRGTIEAQGYSSVIDTTEYSAQAERRWVERVLSWRPAGVVLTGVQHDPEVRQLLRAAGVATLETWDICDDPIDICVGMDHRAAGLLLGRHIARLGYRRPAFVGVERGQDPRAEGRARGIAQAFGEVGVDVLPVHAAPPDNTYRMGADGFRAVLAAHAPDVVCFLSDPMAFGGMMAAARMGLDVPGDIGIAGFNHLDLNTVLPLELTTVRTPRRAMGVQGARALIARIHGVVQERVVALPCELVPGATVRAQ